MHVSSHVVTAWFLGSPRSWVNAWRVLESALSSCRVSGRFLGFIISVLKQVDYLGLICASMIFILFFKGMRKSNSDCPENH
jgi:hypothetical protein